MMNDNQQADLRRWFADVIKQGDVRVFAARPPSLDGVNANTENLYVLISVGPERKIFEQVIRFAMSSVENYEADVKRGES